MATEIKVPTVGESISEVTLAEWLVEDGDIVEMDQVLCELESDKATFELTAEVPGKIKLIAEAGQDLNIGDVVCTIEKSEEKPTAKKSDTKEEQKEEKVSEGEKSEKVETEEKADTYAKSHPSPAASKILTENNLDPEKVKGSGKDGRITKEDALKAVENKSDDKKADTTKGESSSKVFTGGEFSREHRQEKMSKLRQTISKKLVAAKNDTAMLTTFNEVDMGPVMAIRTKYKEAFKKKFDVNLGFMSFFTRACCIALQEFPAVNGKIEDDTTIVLHDYCDISIAVSTPRGLVVPVIRNAESLSIEEIEKKVMDLAIRGRDNKLSIDEMTGGTFTISNGGVFGSLMSTPILNAPQSAILGMHKIQERTMVIDGEIVIRPMMYLALSYDHRIIDGKESVTFLVKVKELLEKPEFLLHGEDPAKLLLGL
ncbi:MAG: 2-oxoglutarate dehydrogenase complex dihydrolipoyllysine-residue succinyltransferase [Chitinophagaceae bacterium]|nr:MAG: 2-oxoglutarate dehydrogenase complex dihydrolipoyllysine-residue succinyltransferase [Chitinophagaceae bacterium]